MSDNWSMGLNKKNRHTENKLQLFFAIDILLLSIFKTNSPSTVPWDLPEMS